MTPEKGFDFSKFVKDSDSATRRKLILKRRVSDETEKPVLNLNVPEVFYFNLFLFPCFSGRPLLSTFLLMIILIVKGGRD